MFHFRPVGWSRLILLATASCLIGAAQPLMSADEASGNKPGPPPRGQVIEAVGTIEPMDTVEVSSEVAGKITSVMVDFSAVVRKGEVLAKIDDTAYRIRRDMAKASLEQAQANLSAKEAEYAFQVKTLQRLKALFSSGGGTAESLDVLQLRVESAAASVKSAKAEVFLHEAAVELATSEADATTILSPMDGVILDSRVHVGQSVVPNSRRGLFLIASDLRRMQLLLSVSERDVVRVRPGQPVQFTLEAFKDRTFTAQVAKARLATSPQSTGTYTVEANFANSDGRVLPYMAARARIEVGAGDHETK